MKKLFFLFIAVAIIFPIVHFVFFSPFYDRAGEWLFLFNQGFKKTSKENISSIKQPIVSPSDQFSRIVVNASVSKTSKIRLGISAEKTDNLREEEIFIAPKKEITWDFPQIDNSQNKTYLLQIDIPEESRNNIRFYFFSTDQQSSIIINDEQAHGLSLATHTESKFSTPLEKIQTLATRVKIYKPPLIQIIFFPLMGLYIVLFAVSAWHGLKIILSEEAVDKK